MHKRNKLNCMTKEEIIRNAKFPDEDDILLNTEEFISMAGNHVYIEIEETGTYLLQNHLLKDSIAVNVGDRVKIGDYLDKVRNTGTTSEPHLHIHHQKQNPNHVILPTFAEGLPLYFYNDEKIKYMPVKGEVLQNTDI